MRALVVRATLLLAGLLLLNAWWTDVSLFSADSDTVKPIALRADAVSGPSPVVPKSKGRQVLSAPAAIAVEDKIDNCPALLPAKGSFGSVCECLAAIRCAAFAASRDTRPVHKTAALLTVFTDIYAKLVLDFWFPRAAEIGYPHAAALRTDPGQPPTLVGQFTDSSGERVDVECPVDLSRGAESEKIGAHMGGDKLGAPKMLLVQQALTCGADAVSAAIMSEADIVLLRDPLSTPIYHEWNTSAVPFPEVWWKHDPRARSRGLVPVAKPWTPAEDTENDLLISGHYSHPRVNIGFFVVRASEGGRRLMREFFTAFSRARKEDQLAWDQAVFDNMIGNCKDIAKLVTPLPQLPSGEPAVRWRALPPTLYKENCDLGFCFGTNSDNSAAFNATLATGPISYHFTCTELGPRLDNMYQLYQNGTCNVCTRC